MAELKTLSLNMKFHIFNNGLMVETGVSGSDRRAMEWAKIFLKEGFRINLFTSVYGRKRFEKYGPNLRLIISSETVFFKNAFLAYLYRGLSSSLKVKNVKEGDVLYSTSDLLADSIPAIISKFRFPKAKWMTGLHLIAPNPFKNYSSVFKKGISFPSVRGIYYFITQRLIIFFAKQIADLVLVSNNLDRKFLLDKGFDEKKVIVTYGSVDWPKVEQAKAKKIQYEAAFIGRYHPQKGLGDLLNIWKTVCQQIEGAKMVMMGELEPLITEVKKIGLQQNIEFVGFIDGVQKFELLKKSQLFLFPSTHESFGMVACEAMACGLPVIAYDLPIYEDIYPEGMVKVPIGNWEKLAEEVLNLLGNDRERKILSRKARSVAAEFSWQKTAEKILKKLRENE